MWLNRAELRKIDGFQAKCLRSILRIPLPYIGRILNATVLQRSRCKQLSTFLKLRQCFLFLFHRYVAWWRCSNLVVFFARSASSTSPGSPPSDLGFRSVQNGSGNCWRFGHLTWATPWRRQVALAGSLFLFSSRLITPLAFPAHVSPYTRRMNEKKHILHIWNQRVRAFTSRIGSKSWSEISLRYHWNLAQYFATLPRHRWIKTVLAWQTQGHRRIGRPKCSCDSMIAHFAAWRIYLQGGSLQLMLSQSAQAVHGSRKCLVSLWKSVWYKLGSCMGHMVRKD